MNWEERTKNWKPLKEKAWEKSQKNIWNIWKPILIIGLISGVVGFILGLIAGEEVGGILNSILSVALIPMEVGLIAYILGIVRNKENDLSVLTKYYNKFVVIFVISFLVGLFSALWAILLIVPGVICALGYSMVYYIFVDNDEITYSDCMNKSKEMMDGNKLDYFLYQLSFIGWALLCLFIIPAIWVIPYITVAEAEYYENLKKKAK